MIQNKTFNNAIDTLKSLGSEHHQINTTTTGDIWKIDMDNTLFPLFHINPVNVTTGLSSLTYNFQLFVMDAVTEKENWTEGEYTLEPFQERFDNLLTGWVFSIGIEVQNDFQACTIPVADNPIGQ